MNIELIKQTVFEDCQRRLNDVLSDAVMMEKEETGLYLRILKTDRSLLYRAMGQVLDVSQSGNLNNRDELSFFESLHHLFHYYMYDDGTLDIQWEKYSIKKCKYVKCKAGKGVPVLTTKADDCDGRKPARENDIHWLLDWHEKEQEERKQSAIELFGEDDEDVKFYDKKEFINYEEVN